jgi:hypothetical protein
MFPLHDNCSNVPLSSYTFSDPCTSSISHNIQVRTRWCCAMVTDDITLRYESNAHRAMGITYMSKRSWISSSLVRPPSLFFSIILRFYISCCRMMSIETSCGRMVRE